MRLIVGRTKLVKLALITVAGAIFGGLMLVGSGEKATASAFGPTQAHTNAPLEGNCTACHTDFELDSGEGGVTITGVPANYTPGQQITVTVTATQEDAVIYGFQLTAIDSAGQKVGDFSIPPASEDRIQILQGVVGPNNIVREYVEHTSGGLSNGQFGFNSWVFTWTAPMQPAGKVDFYVASNSANSDGGPAGDYIYSTSKSTLPMSAAVSITGKVTSPSGLVLRNTKVVLTDSTGVQTSAFTSSFGIYTFSGIPGGANYTLGVLSKRYRFAPKTLTPAGNLTDVDFIGLE